MFILHYKKIFFAFSILLVLVSAIGIISKGFNWGIDFNYLVPLGEKGLYALMGASGTMPGFAGSIGKIQMQSASPYSTVHSNIRMYSVKIFLGVGFHVPSLRSKRSKTTVLR